MGSNQMCVVVPPAPPVRIRAAPPDPAAVDTGYENRTALIRSTVSNSLTNWLLRRYRGYRDVLHASRRWQLAGEDDPAVPDLKAAMSITIRSAEAERPVEHRAIARRHNNKRYKGANRRVGRQRWVRRRKHQV
jgi:hypothetical protein